ncbi:hypothetical protein [Morococcus cerebrosus]|uniref:hypothetical protein n=1 Tax=Morococcus cerebrosus TaxID=1056807 RepID=UPI00114D1A36|nr:hypothetical protein [Morococcus cerebrosus]
MCGLLFYGRLKTWDGISDGFLLWLLRAEACVWGLFRRSSEIGFLVSDDLFAGVFRGQSPRYGRFQTTFWVGAGSWLEPTPQSFSDDLCG